MVHRLNSLFLLTWLLLAAGCGGGSNNATGALTPTAGSGSIAYQRDAAQLISSTEVSKAMSELVERSAVPMPETFPGIPMVGNLGRHSSEVTPYTRQGADTYATGGNTLALGNSLAMISPSSPSFAVYEVGGFGQSVELTRLTVNTSMGNFKGDHPGYWVGIANFDDNSWEMLGLTQDTGFVRNFGGTSAYTGTAGGLYVFVLVTGQQEVTVDSVTLEIDDAVWTEVEVDEGPDAGWTPAIAFLTNDNPIVIYADYTSTNVLWAAADRATDLGDTDNWGTATLSAPAGDVQGHWLDLTVDPEGNPVASMVFSNIGTGTVNSQLGYGVYANDDGNWVWNVLVLPARDGLEYTSICRNPVTDIYAIAHTAANINSGASDYELFIELIDIGDPNTISDDSQNVISGFPGRYPGREFRYPHLDFRGVDGSGDDGHVAVCADGGYVYYGAVGSADGWFELFTEANTDGFGSVAFDPVTNELAQTLSYNNGGTGVMDFVDYNSGEVGFRGTIADISITADEKIGSTSQVQYAPDGTPGVVYTRHDGNHTDIMYAYYDGDWVIEQVNTSPVYPGAHQIIVDLAYDSTGVAGVCWNQVNAGGCSLHVALRGV